MNLPIIIGISPNLHIRAVIASENIKMNKVSERCPALIYSISERQYISKTVFDNYYFEWSEKEDAIALGYGSLVNHSYNPNAYVDFDYENKEIIFIAKRDIEKDEEIMINYNDDSAEPIEESYLTFDKRLNG